jgi:O-antigen/teichoic acid export membrane protein
MRFRSLALADGVEAVLRTLTALTLAALGFRYWALVLAGVVGRLASTVALAAICHRRLAMPSPWQSIAVPVRFGAHVVAGGLAWYAYTNADIIVVGRCLGVDSLGLYTLAWSLASVPLERIFELIGRVTPALFSAVQQDVEALQRYLFRFTEVIALFTFPAGVGLALVAPEAVSLVLGPRWEAAVGPLQFMAVAAALRSVAPLLNQILVAKGRPDLTMWGTIWIVAILSPLFYVGSRWGVSGVAAVWVLGYPIVTCAFPLRYTLSLSKLRLGAYLRALWLPARATAVMSAAVLLTNRLTLPYATVTRLTAAVGVGVLAYAASHLALNRVELARYLRWYRSTIRAGTPAAQ